MSSDQRKPGEVVRWHWISACFAIGAVILGLAWLGERWWDWQGVWSSILVETGAAFALAGILFLLERKFAGAIIEASARAGQQAAEQTVRQVEERLGARLDDLQGQLSDRMRQTTSEQDQTIAALEREVSFETVTALLAEGQHA